MTVTGRKSAGIEPLVAMTQFAYPKAVAVDGRGGLYVGANGYAGGLEKLQLDEDGPCRPVWTVRPGRVRGLCCLPSGDLLATVKTEEGCAVHRFSAAGELRTRWGTPGGEPGQLCNPTGITADDQGNLFILDCSEWGGSGVLNRNRVQVFTTDGHYLHGWGEMGAGPGMFNLPVGIARGADGTIVVADTYNARVQRFSPEGELLDCWGTLGVGPGQLNNPQGIVCAEDGTLFVADTHNDRIQHCTADGRPLACWGQRGSEAQDFWLPCALALTGEGTLVVADTMNSRIKVYPAAGRERAPRE